jgi:hypothetical protein
MTIFNRFTGNALINNALMTIMAVAKIGDLAEITPELLLDLFNRVSLVKTNKRLKSYTMLFSLNNPLVNPAKKANQAGEKTYIRLLLAIMNGFEADGERICEITGLKFNKRFEEFYQEDIDQQKLLINSSSKDPREIKKEIKNLDNTDTSLNRSWFPLIGGLGSDAQTLPQAKFTVNIHPICIAILQFLPLSALLYKGGILLIDSSDFELSKKLVADSVAVLAEKMQHCSVNEPIENVRDFGKGDYLIKVLQMLEELEEIEENYADLNMWSFSNSGTGASCSIDRVPNGLIRKLQHLYNNAKIGGELKAILADKHRAFRFLESLEGNKDWSLLYPNVFGTGKKKTDYSGVSTEFLEAYYSEIGNNRMVPIAKYIAGLIETYRSNSFKKLLERSLTGAWDNPEYRGELNLVLVKAAKEGRWDLKHHIAILDNSDELPVKNNFYKLHKLIHFFTQKSVFQNDLPIVDVSNKKAFNASQWVISMIQRDDKLDGIKSGLTNKGEDYIIGYGRIFIDSLNYQEVHFESILDTFYDVDFRYQKYGMTGLLRIFFNQSEYESIELEHYENKGQIMANVQCWLEKLGCFVNDYRAYYITRYQNPDSDKPPVEKFEKLVNGLVGERYKDDFYIKLKEIIFNTNQFIYEFQDGPKEKWDIEELKVDPLGNPSWNLCNFAIRFLLKKSLMELKKNN